MPSKIVPLSQNYIHHCKIFMIPDAVNFYSIKEKVDTYIQNESRNQKLCKNI